MRNRIWLAAGGRMLAASISLLGAATAASASTARACFKSRVTAIR